MIKRFLEILRHWNTKRKLSKVFVSTETRVMIMRPNHVVRIKPAAVGKSELMIHSGRWSCKNPALSQIPRREHIVPKIVEMDTAEVERRVLVSVAEKRRLAAFTNPALAQEWPKGMEPLDAGDDRERDPD